MFIILEGSGTLRVAGEMLPIRQGDVIFIPPGPEYPHQDVYKRQHPAGRRAAHGAPLGSA